MFEQIGPEMSDHCCQGKASELSKLKKRQARVLWVVLAINLLMFVIEFVCIAVIVNKFQK